MNIEQIRHLRIEHIAYYFWEVSGKPNDKALEHWLLAESCLNGEGVDPFLGNGISIYINAY